MMKHIEGAHGVKTSMAIYCEPCKTAFATKDAKKKHDKEQHGPNAGKVAFVP